MKWYPLRFTHIYKEKVWGGRKLETLFGRKLPHGVPVGESWEIVDHGDDISRVSNGELAGTSLRALMNEYPHEVLGKRVAERGFDRFPLLVKLIDASDRLSVQVHPPDAYAYRHEGGEWGKTEMWYVVHADREATLINGFAGGTTREGFVRALQQGSGEACLESVPVERGDVAFVPAGRVHAIGAGNLILEIQQNSDVTYRVYDWGRAGMDGKPRELHMEKALNVMDFHRSGSALVEKKWEEGEGFRSALLVECAYFRSVVYEIATSLHARCDGQRFGLVSCVEGGVVVRYNGGDSQVACAAGETILLPAVLGEVTFCAGEKGCSLVKTEVP